MLLETEVDESSRVEVEPARDFIAEWGGEFLISFPKAVSMGVRLLMLQWTRFTNMTIAFLSVPIGITCIEW